MFHEIGCALDRVFESDIIYLDFAKTFDSAYPAKLVSKLKAFGIEDPLLKWFQSYLTENKQRVVINGTYSAWTDVGSILFLSFVNLINFLMLYYSEQKQKQQLGVAEDGEVGDKVLH